jgi:hypothetical protein
MAATVTKIASQTAAVAKMITTPSCMMCIV